MSVQEGARSSEEGNGVCRVEALNKKNSGRDDTNTTGDQGKKSDKARESDPASQSGGRKKCGLKRMA